METTKKGKKALVKDDVSRRFRRRGKNKFGKRGQIYGAAANQIRKDIGYLFSVLNVEDKYRDISSGSVTLSAAWQGALLNGLSQGTTPSTRIGQSVKTVGLEFRWTVYINASSTLGQTFRIVIFTDKFANNTAPTFTDVYTASPISPRVVAFLERFHVLYEIRSTLSPDGQEVRVDDYIRPQQWHVKFNTANNGTIADITSNSLYVIYISDQSANFPTLVYESRFIYVDN
jgi:hypothetical protein